jgi:preprotein translocase subunit SecA
MKTLGRSDKRTYKMIMDRYKKISDKDDNQNYYHAELKERNAILESEFLAQLPSDLSAWLNLSNVSDDQKEELIEEFNYIANLRATKNKVKVGRNDPCPCGSGKKYKKCCLK